MKAVLFDASVPCQWQGKALGVAHKPFVWNGLSCLCSGDTPQPSPVGFHLVFAHG
jgi:hypothetical protein